MFKRIDHIELLTDAPDRAVAFYKDAFGFRELLEVTRLLFPALPFGLDALEPVSQHVELLFEAGFRLSFALQLLVEIGGACLRFAERVL